MPQEGTSIGRRSFGTNIIAVVNGFTRRFPGEIQGLAESSPGATGARDTRVPQPSGRTKVVPAAATEQEQKTVTLSCELAAHLLDYQAIARLRGSQQQMMIQQVREELPVAGVTPAGSTVAISQAFVAAFAGNSHPTNVPEGAAIRIGGKNFVLAELEVPGDAGANVDLNSALHLLSVRLDRQGVTAADVYKSLANASLAAAVAAGVYSVVMPKTDTGLFAVRVLSAPRWGNFQGAEVGTFVGGDIVLEVVGDDIPFEQVQDLPTVS